MRHTFRDYLLETSNVCLVGRRVPPSVDTNHLAADRTLLSEIVSGPRRRLDEADVRGSSSSLPSEGLIIRPLTVTFPPLLQENNGSSGLAGETGKMLSMRPNLDLRRGETLNEGLLERRQKQPCSCTSCVLGKQWPTKAYPRNTGSRVDDQGSRTARSA